jgi:hypothetical protein
MRFGKLTSLSSKRDIQLLNNLTASCPIGRQLHIRRMVRGQTKAA